MPNYYTRADVASAITLLERGAAHEYETLPQSADALKIGPHVYRLASGAYWEHAAPQDTPSTAARRCAGAAEDLRAGRLPRNAVRTRLITPAQIDEARRALQGEAVPAILVVLDAVREHRDDDDLLPLIDDGLPAGWELDG